MERLESRVHNLALQAENLSSVSHITHGFFTRQGGVSAGIFASLNCGPGSGDDKANVRENRERVRKAMSAAHLSTLYQIHGAEVVQVTEPWETGTPPKGDGMVTNVPGMALGILTADCVPLLFADSRAQVIGAAHAGWKGAFSGVAENTLRAMEALGAARERIAVAVGPAIAQASYEVGEEFYARFMSADEGNERFFVAEFSGQSSEFSKGKKERDHKAERASSTRSGASCEIQGAFHGGERKGTYHFNLPGYVRQTLKNAGITDINVVEQDTCREEERFFSYRRTTLRGEPDYGRQISCIVIK